MHSSRKGTKQTPGSFRVPAFVFADAFLPLRFDQTLLDIALPGFVVPDSPLGLLARQL